MGYFDDAREWVRDHKIKAVGGFWLTTVVGTAAFQWSRPIPTQLKVIHTRVYAQAMTLAALAMAGLVDVYEHRHQTSKELEAYHQRLHDIEMRYGKDAAIKAAKEHDAQAAHAS